MAIATAAIPDPKRKAEPRDTAFLPSLMERSNLSILRTRIQKLYVPKQAPTATPAKTVGYEVNPHPNAQRASKKNNAFFCIAKM